MFFKLRPGRLTKYTANFMDALFQYDKLSKLVKDFDPFRSLWITTSDWLRWHESWMNDPLTSIDAESLEKNVSESYKTMHKSVKIFADIPGRDMVFCEKREEEAF